MHPAPSLIVFTTLSGLGFGLLVWVSLTDVVTSTEPLNPLYFLAFLLCLGGLAASTFHLGHPERAWRAFTQWRSSWLSREAWAAAATLAVTALHIALILLGIPLPILGLLIALLSLVTVASTAMIYGQIRAVPRWNQPATPVLFVALSLAGGAIPTLPPFEAAMLLLLAGAVQLWTWKVGDTGLTGTGTDLGTATGLTGRGAVRAFEPPHTGRSYLLDEMVFRVGRKHANRLRRLSLAGMAGLPAILLLAPAGPVTVALALLLHVLGVLAARWLFFAQAEHTVGLYYGQG